MSFQVMGNLHHIGDIEQKTDSFLAREFVIEVNQNSNYPQLIKFQLVQDRCGLVDNYQVGQEITVHFDLRGREWNGKYFTNLNAWKLQGSETSQTNHEAKEKVSTAQAEGYNDPLESNTDVIDDDDLPF